METANLNKQNELIIPKEFAIKQPSFCILGQLVITLSSEGYKKFGFNTFKLLDERFVKEDTMRFNGNTYKKSDMRTDEEKNEFKNTFESIVDMYWALYEGKLDEKDTIDNQAFEFAAYTILGASSFYNSISGKGLDLKKGESLHFDRKWINRILPTFLYNIHADDCESKKEA